MIGKSMASQSLDELIVHMVIMEIIMDDLIINVTPENRTELSRKLVSSLNAHKKESTNENAYFIYNQVLHIK